MSGQSFTKCTAARKVGT